MVADKSLGGPILKNVRNKELTIIQKPKSDIPAPTKVEYVAFWQILGFQL